MAIPEQFKNSIPPLLNASDVAFSLHQDGGSKRLVEAPNGMFCIKVKVDADEGQTIFENPAYSI